MDKKLPIEFKTKWLEALRSGKYEQTTGYMHARGGFCCLGVAVDLCGADWRPIYSSNVEGVCETGPGCMTKPGSHDLPVEIFKILEADVSARVEDGSVMGHLIDMNDGATKSFSEIADWIEEHL